jgi:hypothetical protein
MAILHQGGSNVRERREIARCPPSTTLPAAKASGGADRGGIVATI